MDRPFAFEAERGRPRGAGAKARGIAEIGIGTVDRAQAVGTAGIGDAGQ